MSFSTRIITLLILLQVLVFAADCDAGFSDDVNVRVINEDFVLIEGAEVILTYQLDRSTAKGYFSANKTTDENGMANFSISNLEVDPEKVDCDIEIVVRFDDEEETTTVTANAHARVLDVDIDAYSLTIKVVDQDNKPIEDVEVFVQDRSKVTNAVGLAHYLVGEGNVRILAKYDIGKVEDTIEVTEPLVHTIGFAFYPLKITAIDDNGDPVDVTIVIEEEEYNVQGELELEKIAKANPYTKVSYGTLEKELEVDLAVQTEYTVVFDLTPPQLAEVKQLFTSTPDRLKLGIAIIDEGPYASGIAGDGITLSYRYDTGEWQEIRVYSIALHQYGADLPLQEDVSVLFFTIDAVDVEGNQAFFEGQLLLEQEIETNETEPPEPPPEEDDEEPEELPIPLIVGIIVVAIGIYLVYKFKLSQGGGNY